MRKLGIGRRQQWSRPDKVSSKKSAAGLFILQGGAEPLSSVSVWEEPGQLLIGKWARTIMLIQGSILRSVTE